MARKVKAQKPPLSTIDKVIYLGTCAFFVLVSLSLMFFLLSRPSAFAFADEAVVAMARQTGTGAFCLPFLLFLGLAPTFFLSLMMENRQPIVGNKKFKPKPNERLKKVYPLFSRAFRENLSDDTRRLIKRSILISVTILLLLAALIPFGIFRRATIDGDYVIRKFGVLNQVTQTYAARDADDILVHIEYYDDPKSYSRTYYFAISLVFGDEKYTFARSEFDEMNTEEALQYMIALKNLAPDRVTIEHTDRMERLLRERDYTGEEIALIYELFEYNK